MQTPSTGALPGTDRFDYVESLIARYPDTTEAEVEDLKRWFTREASAFDVASLASKESIHARYAAFRAEHIDGFRAKDYAVAAIAIAIAAAVIVYFAFYATA
ncbi:hypothetical protein [Parafrankia sp. BMG5.11]|uniref:hypothetical protein n=1 Tax=Parafrankia sp. BMG5.11 TaxID=222540 RepID=UPI00103B7DEC|nr:hypothetical protein [Parafrankia sp. BMG5.11]TCJ38321.1 hypothetical protein E0504_15280 [Parafrankia sp. BMG5.11]